MVHSPSTSWLATTDSTAIFIDSPLRDPETGTTSPKIIVPYDLQSLVAPRPRSRSARARGFVVCVERRLRCPKTASVLAGNCLQSRHAARLATLLSGAEGP